MNAQEILQEATNSSFAIWFLIGAGLVFFMQAGFAMVETGFTRAKNAGNIIMKNLMDFCIGTLMYIILGFGLMMSEDYIMGIIGVPNLDIFTNYNSFNWSQFVFQLVFCATAATIVSGAMAERTKFSAYCIYSGAISLIVYPIEAGWVWNLGGNGWLQQLHFVDFAGSAVIHSVGGMAALVGAIIVGPRIGKYTKRSNGSIRSNAIAGHSITLGALGCFILWFGWYGFNAGSALAANGLAAHAFMTTSVSAAAGLVSWMLIEVFSEGKTTLVGASTGLVIGLVAITPGAGFVPMWAAVICGLLVSPICYFGVKLIKGKLKIDDALDAFGCHGIGGIWGGIATGLFGMTSINGVAKWNGLVFGETRLFVAQIIGIFVSIAVAVVGSLICIAIVRIFTPLRVEERAEKIGLDVSEHGENAYPSFNGLD